MFFCCIARMQITSIAMTMMLVFFMLYWDDQATMIKSKQWPHGIAREQACDIILQGQKRQLHFLRHIAREQMVIQWYHYHKDGRGSCKGMAMKAHHATIKPVYAVDPNNHSNDLISQEAMTRITCFMLWYCTARMTVKRKREIVPPNKLKWLLEQQRQLQRRQCACDKDRPRLPLQRVRQSKVCHFAGNNDDERWLIATKAHMPSSNQQFFICIAGASNDHKTMTSTTWWSIFLSYVILQEVTLMATTVDCSKRARLPKQQPTLWMMWINRINNCESAKRQ